MTGTKVFSYLFFLAFIFYAFSAQADRNNRIQKKITTTLNKHAIKSTKGKVGHHTKISKYDYAAKNCKLLINWHLEWHNALRGSSDTDKGANYTIPLSQVILKPDLAPNRIKLSCTTKECITKRMHRSCQSRRRCRQTKTYNAYFIRISSEQKPSLIRNMKKLIKICKASPISS